MRTTMKQGAGTGNGYTVRQLTAEERRACDAEAADVAAEIEAQHSGARGWLRRVGDAIVGAGRRVRCALTRENMDAAIEGSKSFAALAVKYGANYAKQAVQRRVERAIEDRINGVVGGGVGGTK